MLLVSVRRLLTLCFHYFLLLLAGALCTYKNSLFRFKKRLCFGLKYNELE